MTTAAVSKCVVLRAPKSLARARSSVAQDWAANVVTTRPRVKPKLPVAQPPSAVVLVLTQTQPRRLCHMSVPHGCGVSLLGFRRQHLLDLGGGHPALDHAALQLV